MRPEILTIPALAMLLAGCPRGESDRGADQAAAPITVTVDEPVAEPSPEAEEEAPEMLLFEKAVSADGTYVVRYAVKQAAIPLNEPFDLVVTVWDNRDPERPARDVTIDVDARMPQHHHGMTLEPEIRRVEPGRFEVDRMLFHMPGYWEIYVDVTRDEVTERAQFAVNLE